MKIVFKDCKSDKESLLLVILVDDNGNELKKFPVYLTDELSHKLPALDETYSSLADIVEMVYRSGLKGESIDFIKEEITL